MTLEQLVEKYGADASRIALADAGDGVADANFEEDVADKSILKLYTLRDWCEEQVRNEANLRIGPADLFCDLIFADEMNLVVHECRIHYQATNYKLALKAAFYTLTAARDWYREATSATGITMHRDLVFQYIELQALLLCVIAPHWSEYIWLEVLKKPSTIQNARFPSTPPPDPSLSAARDYVRTTTSAITSAVAAQSKRISKGKNTSFDPKKPKKVTIYVASKFPAWQEKYVKLLSSLWDEQTKTVDEDELMSNLKQQAGKDMKKVIAFVQTLKKRLTNEESASMVLQRKLAFDEMKTLTEAAAGIKRAAHLQELDIVLVGDGGEATVVVGAARTVSSLPPQASSAVPGSPTFEIENVEA